MPTRNLNTLFDGWERELLVLLDTNPTHEEFWSYWREREEAVERLSHLADPLDLDAAYGRLLGMAERCGYVRIPNVGANTRSNGLL